VEEVAKVAGVVKEAGVVLEVAKVRDSICDSGAG